MGRRSSVALYICLALAGQSSVPAQEVLQLRDDYVAQSRMLDSEVDAYLAARQLEHHSLQQLLELNEQIDRAMSDPSVPAQELIGLHRDISRARQEAFEISEDVGVRREELAGTMQGLEELARRLADEGVSYVEPNGQVGGTWLIESNEAFGLFSLTQEAGRITGTYRLNSGRKGTVRGRFSGQLEIEVEDVELGPIGSLVGGLTANGDLEGNWSARELAAGKPTGGTVRGRRLSLQDLLTLDP